MRVRQKHSSVLSAWQEIKEQVLQSTVTVGKNDYNAFCIFGNPAKMTINFVQTDLYRLHVVVTCEFLAIPRNMSDLHWIQFSCTCTFIQIFSKQWEPQHKRKRISCGWAKWITTITFSYMACCSTEKKNVQLSHWHKQSLTRVVGIQWYFSEGFYMGKYITLRKYSCRCVIWYW